METYSRQNQFSEKAKKKKKKKKSKVISLLVVSLTLSFLESVSQRPRN
jgi:hypothetical protein